MSQTSKHVDWCLNKAKKELEEERIKEIGDEIGDVLLTIIMISDSLEIDLENVFDKTMQKINSRDKDRTKKDN